MAVDGGDLAGRLVLILAQRVEARRELSDTLVIDTNGLEEDERELILLLGIGTLDVAIQAVYVGLVVCVAADAVVHGDELLQALLMQEDRRDVRVRRDDRQQEQKQ